jgi:hypothetical protein
MKSSVSVRPPERRLTVVLAGVARRSRLLGADRVGDDGGPLHGSQPSEGRIVWAVAGSPRWTPAAAPSCGLRRLQPSHRGSALSHVDPSELPDRRPETFARPSRPGM